MTATALVLAPPTGAWVHHSACRDQWNLMDADTSADAETARALCDICPVQRACLAWVLSLPPKDDVYGIAAGLDADERRDARRRNRRPRRTVLPRTEKRCCRCKQTKPLTEFYRDQRNSDGRQSRCKGCHAEVLREYRAAKASA